ncbi:DNA pilot protein [Antarctic microvirus TYR_006_V_SP_13]|nr:DNA pilot protein [Antarctic microvirus TYR_006_V_SP_13]
MGVILAQAGEAAINTGLGLMLEKHNDRRQVNQQRKLTDVQTGANKDMAMFNNKLQMDMWENTNYKAQVDQMSKAGINPALMYGSTGSGGTTQAAQGGAASGGSAAGNSGEMMGLMMQKAQIENLNANTAKTAVDTENAAGVNKENTVAGTEKTKSETNLKNVEGEIAKIDLQIKGKTAETQIEIIGQTFDKINREVEQLERNNFLNKETAKAKIEMAGAELVGKYLSNTLTEAQTGKTKQETESIREGILQKWKSLNIDEFRAEMEANNPDVYKVAGNMLNSIKGKIQKGMKETYIRPNQVKDK